jgi:hypothetical protein
MSLGKIFERPLKAYCVERLEPHVRRKRKIDNSTVQNSHHGMNAGQLAVDAAENWPEKLLCEFFNT